MNPEKPKSGAGPPASILVVDDTPANLQVLAGMLKDRGYKVRPVPSGKLALLAARRDPPDLILLDIHMPEMNGYEVCEHLKADDQLKGIPVIFISALTEEMDKAKAFAIGGVDYLTKPFQMEELHARVETHLKLRRLRIELEETNARLATANGVLQRKQEELSDLHHRKDEFLAMLSHELRSPLAPIANAVQLLGLQQGSENLIQKQARGIIERQLGQLQHLVGDLLEVSRITTGRVQLRCELVAVSGIVEVAVETARPQIEQRRHELTVSLPTEPIWLHADAARLEQVVVNLLANAAKYTDEEGHIWLTVEQEGDECVLRIRDTGVGITPELLPCIFDLFTQAERSLDRSQGGLGIGLALVHRLTDLHGGKVEATSVLGQGSEFVVRLPVLTAEPQSSSSPTEKAKPTGPCLRVLVVDDSVDTAESVMMLLQACGHDVCIAHDGPTALQLALDYRPDVVLLDIGLPGLDGFEVAKRLRQQSALNNVVLVAITGYGQVSDGQRSQEAGFDHHLVKPVDFAKVENILATISATVT
jgi:signal transduction histidine kinase